MPFATLIGIKPKLKNSRSCVVCGTVFFAPPTSKKISCSKACSGIRKKQTHQGKTNLWSKAARDKLRAKGKTANLALGTPAAQLSPVAGPFETNQEAKRWWLVKLSTHEEYAVTNLRKFCRDHPALFAPDKWENAYAGLRQVQAWMAGKRPRAVTRWKDWTLARPGESIERETETETEREE
jgi:hypothetical protein